MRKYIILFILILTACFAPICRASNFGMYLNGIKVGYIYDKTDPDFVNGKEAVNTYTVSRIRFKAGGIQMNNFNSATALTDTHGNTIYRDSYSKDGETYTRLHADFVGSKIICKLKTDKSELEKEIDIPQDLPFNIDPVAEFFSQSKEERVYEYYEFNETALSIDKKTKTVKKLGRETIEACGKLYDCTKIETVDEKKERSTTWITDDGETIKTTVFGGLVSVIKQSPQENKDLDDWDLIKSAQIVPSRKIENSEKAVRLKFIQHTGSPQTGETCEIISVIGNEALSLSIPITNKAYEKYLEPTAKIDCDNEAIKTFAKSAAGDSTNAYIVCNRLKTAVYKHMIFEDSGVQFQRASDILKTKKGVCRHTALLFAALARSLGIPCRIVDGIAYNQGIFGGHAWVECYIGEWVPFDPTWNSDFVDATHIKLAYDDEDKLFNIFDLNIEILEVDYK